MNGEGVSQQEFGVIIPARYASTRLPGKPLLDLGGKPMVVRVLDIAAQAGAAFTMVATDDDRIVEAVTAAGGEAMITGSEHETGTDRLAEVARRLHLDPDLIVVNLQGDEPALPPALVQRVAEALRNDPDAAMATLATPLRDRRELLDPNVVKVVLNQANRAMYFSRAPVPWLRSELAHPAAAEATTALPEDTFLRHIGVYAYRVSTLLLLSQVRPATIELAEGLEQLRALWLGLEIQVAVVAELPPTSVDTAEDAARVRQMFE
ncbi:MAG TPA: 3-deoxy-manno-octulosonate cytidylyltransferase [Polyangiaceae bacterium]|nr:3-deoxy-manno-octulosonate cytidylyltransferase [Polyangiaceae bacterium]